MSRAVFLVPLLAGLGPLIALGQDDIVRLKDGRFLVGEIVRVGDEGLTLERLDGSGTVRIPWSLIPERDLSRYRTKEGDRNAEKKLDGVRVITQYRIVVGLEVESGEEGFVLVKTKDKRTPVRIPRHAILVKEPYKVTPAEVYTPEERLELAARDVDMTDPDAVERLAQVAVSLGFPAEAMKFYADARSLLEMQIKDLDASGLSEQEMQAKIEAIRKRMDSIDARAKELRASAVLKEIEALAETGDFDAAIQEAKAWLEEFEGTKVRSDHEDLVERLAKEKKEFEQNRLNVLGRKIVRAFPTALNRELRNLSKTAKVNEAIQAAKKLDEVIVQRLARDFKVSREDVEKAWEAAIDLREKRKHRATMGTGTWILRGGQDGGWDRAQRGRDPRGNTGGNRNSGGRLPPQISGRFPGVPVPGQGQWRGNSPPAVQARARKIQTRDEWWKSQSDATRENFLEAVWAESSNLVRKGEARERKCPTCSGIGSLKARDETGFVDVVCPRCHGARVEVEITWW